MFDIGTLTEEDVAHDPGAWHYATHHDLNALMAMFTLANILHTARKTKEASRFYRVAYDMHSKNPTHYPLAQSLLQVRLLCLLKSGMPLPDEELEELQTLSPAMYRYITGIRAAWAEGDNERALSIMGSCYEAFHTGEECDCLYLEIALKQQEEIFHPSRRPIPEKLYMFWDKAPPPEIQQNITYHQELLGADYKIYSYDEAAAFLEDFYGAEARDLFLGARHPAEAADFFRVHAINTHGGWWLDADLRLKDASVLTSNHENRFYLTDNFYIHNDFYGAIANSPVTEDCLLSLYRNSYLHKDLYIAYKTGPGIFNRALNRLIYRNLSFQRSASVRVDGQSQFLATVEEFETPYKHNLPNWQLS